MAGIYYSIEGEVEVARWSGNSIRQGKTVVKDKQIYLGKVIDKEKLIFFKRSEGFYHFDPETQEMESIPDKDVPASIPPLDQRLRPRNVIITFGGSYFIHELLAGIEYDKVIRCLSVKNRDTMFSLLHYYLLSDKADREAFLWYQNSFVRFLYPQANLKSQRISDFYVTFGSDNNRRTFFKKHIPYLKTATDDEFAILIDSTGCQNAVHVPITKVSKHNNEVNIEFRIVLVIQRSTGLPVYYEVIPGNVIDSSTVNRIINMMAMYGFKITHISGDAGYSCPANIEHVILCGSDLIMRLNPAYDLYKTLMEAHRDDLKASAFNEKTDIHYRNRIVRVLKLKTAVATGPNGEAIEGFVYLCRDLQAYYSKSDHYMTSHGKDALTAKEIIDICDKFGIFAIVTTEDLEEKDVLPTYYLRQGVEQFIDFSKNYCKMMPVRGHSLATIQGHMLMSFIATFLVVGIKNRLNIMDTPFVAIPDNFSRNENYVPVPTDNDEVEKIVEQEALMDAFRSNPNALFYALNFVGADVFEDQKDGNNGIVPAVPYKDANEFFKAFGISYPEMIQIKADHSLVKVVRGGNRKTRMKSRFFARRPTATDELILQHREAKKLEQNNQNKADAAEKGTDSMTTEGGSAPVQVKRKPGRPKGSLNKSTIQRLAEQAERGKTDEQSPKRGRGRPLGAKDKKPRKNRKNGEKNN